MKTPSTLLILSALALLSCTLATAQVSLAEDGYGFVPGAYYKDTHDDFDKYVGTWKYINGNTSLTIEFRKRVHHYDSGNDNYYDMLVGEYIYIENGVLKANTMANLDNVNLNHTQNSLSSIYIEDKDITPGCYDCVRPVLASYVMPDRDYLNGKFRIKYYTDGPLKFLRILHYGKLSLVPEGGFTDPIIPEGIFILEKDTN